MFVATMQGLFPVRLEEAQVGTMKYRNHFYLFIFFKLNKQNFYESRKESNFFTNIIYLSITFVCSTQDSHSYSRFTELYIFYLKWFLKINISKKRKCSNFYFTAHQSLNLTK